MKPGTVMLLLCSALVAFGEEPNSDAVRRGQLKHLGGAVKAYQIIYAGKSPAKLSDLYREGLAESFSEFVRPGSPTFITVDSEIDEKSDYTLESMPDTKDLLVREKSPGPDGAILGVFANGAIKVLATSKSSVAGAKPNAANSAFEVIVAIILLGGLVAAALWAYVRWVRAPKGERPRSFSEVVKRAAQDTRRLWIAIGPARAFLKKALQRGGQMTLKMAAAAGRMALTMAAAAGRKLVSAVKSRQTQEFFKTALQRGGQVAQKMAAAGRKSVSAAESLPLEPQPLPAPPAVESKVVTCPSCKAPNPVLGKFCHSCGAPLEASQAAAPPQTAICPGCGKPLKLGAKFCAVCGSPVV
jgi:Double zinc ribbon